MQTAIVQGAVMPVNGRRETEVLIERRAREKSRTRPLLFAALTGAGALSSVFGLFAGMLLPSSAASLAVAGRDTMMGNSLFGMAVEVLRGSLPAANSLYAGALQILLLLMVGTAALGLASSVVAFAAGRTARALSAFTLTFEMLSFGAFAGLVFLGGESFERAIAPDALFPFAAAAVLRAAGIAAKKGIKGLWGSAFLLLSLAAFAAVCLPASPLKAELAGALSLPARGWEATDMVLVVLLGLSALNMMFAVLRLGASKGFAWELVRFLLLLSAAGAAAAVYAAEGNLGLLTAAPLSPMLLGGAAIVGLVLSAGLLAVRAIKKNPKQ